MKNNVKLMLLSNFLLLTTQYTQGVNVSNVAQEIIIQKLVKMYANVNSGTWIQIPVPASWSTSAIEQAAVWTDSSGNAYLFDGFFKNDMWEWNTISKTWIQIPQIGTWPSYRFGSIVWQDQSGDAYVFGGASSSVNNELWVWSNSDRLWDTNSTNRCLANCSYGWSIMAR